ncbi:hypothetical protein Angca_001099, partial [Angiostrongylus cantonensis]
DSSNIRSASEVVLDGSNYRTGSDAHVERQSVDEQEFIVVNTKKKKIHELSGQQQRIGSAGK